MIGNDIVDLAQAQKESNWRRKGFLDKIFTQKEQVLIEKATYPEFMVWNLWSRKEAAYKIYNRETGHRGYYPLHLEINYESEVLGTVGINGKIYFTKTYLNDQYIHTVAVTTTQHLQKIKRIPETAIIIKKNGIPFQVDDQLRSEIPVSISHHGKFWVGIKITN